MKNKNSSNSIYDKGRESYILQHLVKLLDPATITKAKLNLEGYKYIQISAVFIFARS